MVTEALDRAAAAQDEPHRSTAYGLDSASVPPDVKPEPAVAPASAPAVEPAPAEHVAAAVAPTMSTSSDRKRRKKNKRRPRNVLGDLLDGGYWKPRPTPTYGAHHDAAAEAATADGSEGQQQQRAEVIAAHEQEGRRAEERRKKKRQRREEKVKERLTEQPEQADAARQPPHVDHRDAGGVEIITAREDTSSEQSDVDSLADTSDSEGERHLSAPTTTTTTNGEQVAIKDIYGGLDGDYWKVRACVRAL
jgi:hypothetical protein